MTSMPCPAPLAIAIPPLPPPSTMRSTSDQPQTKTTSPSRSSPIQSQYINPSALPFKRRAVSFSDRLPSRLATKNAVANAFANVSTATTAKLAKFRSSSDNFMKKAPSSWKFPPMANINSSIIRRGGKYTWTNERLQHASARFEYHGEDAGAAASYFHIVADGVSSPFGRNSLANVTFQPVSSDLIAQELVRCVQEALDDITNKNSAPIDARTLESAVVDAIKTTRIKCFLHRQSRLATTLVVAYFDRWNGKLHTFTLGDSKCIVVRQGEIVYETLAVLREFNVPCVVNLSNQVTSSDYIVQSFNLQPNDICLTFSDGLGDNLYKDDIVSALTSVYSDCEEDQPKSGSDDALQQACDLLLSMSKLEDVRVSSIKKNHNPQDEVARKASFFPFATAAVLEYRARALEECSTSSTVEPNEIDHLAVSEMLFEQHYAKETLDRHVVVRKMSRKRHYSLMQLKRMAEMQTKKPDDITLFMTRFT